MAIIRGSRVTNELDSPLTTLAQVELHSIEKEKHFSCPKKAMQVYLCDTIQPQGNLQRFIRRNMKNRH